jgi:hypothetical protein
MAIRIQTRNHTWVTGVEEVQEMFPLHDMDQCALGRRPFGVTYISKLPQRAHLQLGVHSLVRNERCNYPVTRHDSPHCDSSCMLHFLGELVVLEHPRNAHLCALLRRGVIVPHTTHTLGLCSMASGSWPMQRPPLSFVDHAPNVSAVRLIWYENTTNSTKFRWRNAWILLIFRILSSSCSFLLHRTFDDFRPVLALAAWGNHPKITPSKWNRGVSLDCFVMNDWLGSLQFHEGCIAHEHENVSVLQQEFISAQMIRQLYTRRDTQQL